MKSSGCGIKYQDVSPYFTKCYRWHDVMCKGWDTSVKSITFSGVDKEDQPQTVAVQMIIDKEQRLMWDSAHDMIKDTMHQAQSMVRGSYQFILLAMDWYQGLSLFKWSEFSQLVVNHTRLMKAGDQSLIRYCTCFGALRKLSEAHWGKIQFLNTVSMMDKPVEKFDLFVKSCMKGLKDRKPNNGILFYDLSDVPILNSSEIQAERWQKFIKTFDDTAPKSIHMYDRSGLSELYTRPI